MARLPNSSASRRARRRYAIVTIQRVDKLNLRSTRGWSAELTRAFHDLELARRARKVRAAILTGAGKAFVAGGGIAEDAGAQRRRRQALR